MPMMKMRALRHSDWQGTYLFGAHGRLCRPFVSNNQIKSYGGVFLCKREQCCNFCV